MEPPSADDLVRVATDGAQIEGIVLERLSGSKAVVAVMDRVRGPVLRTVEQKALSVRAEAGPDDRALRLLIRRTPHATRGGARGGSGAGPGRPGHTRAATHRPTGR